MARRPGRCAARTSPPKPLPPEPSLSAGAVRRSGLKASDLGASNARPRPQSQRPLQRLLAVPAIGGMAKFFRKKRGGARSRSVWYEGGTAFPPSAWKGPARTSPYGYESDSDADEASRLRQGDGDRSRLASGAAGVRRELGVEAGSPAVLPLNGSRRRDPTPADVYLDGFPTLREQEELQLAPRPVQKSGGAGACCQRLVIANVVILLFQVLVLTGTIFYSLHHGHCNGKQ
ncbi:membrane protein V1 [Equid alphaherpesvirus 3]|uniref:Membrane protein V1 n=1 Tax=Equid alphaherpesvirus 3 TaxID=80341 RepID=A0A077B7H1_9ALPH|nr:membrane protein V1 [Equid alphaherpesvirus 3]AIL02919.1 membrane protein V1 [Equid alphaherpesvirus 3]